jgi:hypothetical protein
MSLSPVPVAHICNPNYLGGWGWEDHSSRPAQTKKFVRHHLNGKKLAMVACTCHSSDDRKLKIGSLSKPTWPKSKAKPEHNGWRGGSSTKSACLASVKPWVQTPVLRKKKKVSVLIKLIVWLKGIYFWHLNKQISSIHIQSLVLNDVFQ